MSTPLFPYPVLKKPKSRTNLNRILFFLFAAITMPVISSAQISGTLTVCTGATTTLTDATSGGTWSSSTTTVATVGSSTGVVFGVAAGVADITYISIAGTHVATVTVNPLPSLFIVSGSGTSYCSGGAGIHITLSGSQTGVNYQLLIGGSPTGSPIAGTGSSLDFGFLTAAGLYTIAATNTATGCVRNMAGSVNVAINPLPTLFNVTGGGTYCTGGAGLHIGLNSSTVGVEYQLYNGVTATGSPVAGTGSSLDFGLLTTGGTYTVVGTNTSTLCAATMNGSAVIVSNPTPVLTCGPTSVCVSASITSCTPSLTGGTWTVASSSIATIGGTTGVVTGVSTGTTTITYTMPTGCFATSTVSVTSIPCAPVASSPTVCIGSTSNLTDCVTGGVWTSGTTGIATIGSLSGIATGVSAGTVTITYSLGSSCTTTIVITVNPLPLAITGPSFVCVGSTMTLSDATTGGTWSSTTPATATVSGTGVVTGVAPGVDTIVYTAGCSVRKPITVNSSPSAIGGPSVVCAGSNITLTNSVAGGSWTSGSTAIAGIGSATGILSGITPGTSLITYSIGGCVATRIVTVNAIAPIVGSPGVCIGTTSTLTDAVTGGIWSSSTPSVAPVGASTGIVTGVTPGTAVISYTMPTGCSAILTVTVNTTPLPVSGSLNICSGTSTTLTDGTPGGVWSSGTTSVATIGSTSGIVNGISGGTSQITYTLGGSCTAIVTFTVDAAPAAISGPTSVCEGGAITLTDAITGGTWSSSLPSLATVGTTSGVVSGIAAGTVIITYTVGTAGCKVITPIVVNPVAPITGVTNMCPGATTTLSNVIPGGIWTSGTPAVATVVPTTGTVTGAATGTALISYTLPSGCIVTTIVTVDALPAPITGTTSVCLGGITTLADATTGGTWSSSNTAIATVSGTGDVSGISSGTVTISYTAGCTITTTVTVNSLPSPILGSGGVCLGHTIPLTNALTGGTWASSNPLAATVGSSSGMVTGLIVGPVTITYTLPSGCTTTKIVTVTSIPTAITGTMSVCAGATTLLTEAIAGGTWSSSSPGIASIDPGTGLATGNSPGVATITYSIGSACTVTATVTVNTLPSTITGSPNICIGTPGLLSNTVPGGSWSSSDPLVATIGGSTGIVTGIMPGSAVISYILATGCGTSALIFVDTPPAPISGTLAVCVGTSSALSDATSGGTWSSSSFLIATVSTGGVVTGWNTGTTVISYTLPGSFCSATAVVSVNSFPSVISGPTNLCTGNAATMTNAVTGGIWSSSNPAIASINAVTGVVTGVTSGSVNITYSMGSGCNTVTSIVINPVPATITGAGSVCSGFSILLSDATPGGTWSSSAPTIGSISTGGVLTGITTGTTNISYTNSFGCHATRLVTVNPSPGPITGSGNVCLGATTPLADAVPGGTWTSANIGVAVVGSSSGIAGGVALGTTTITYQLPAGCLTTTSVTVIALPTVFAMTGGGNHCTWDTGVHVGLTGSVVGVNYMLYAGSTAIGPFAGTGSALDFGLHTTPGTYTATATSTGTTCSAYMAGSVTIGLIPTVVPSVAITVSPNDTVCAGTTATFAPAPVYGGAGPVYDWKVNGVHVAFSGTYAYIPALGDTVSVIMTSNALCASPAVVTGSIAPTVLLIRTPVVSLSFNPGDTVCLGTPVTVTPVPSNGGTAPTFTWVKNGTSATAGATYSFIPDDGDNIYCVMTSNYPCLTNNPDTSDIATMQVDTPLAPVVVITANPGTTIYFGQSDTLTATATHVTAPTYQWYVNNTLIAGATNNVFISNSFTYPGHDSVTCVVANHGVCGGSGYQWVYITSVPSGVANVSPGNRIHISPNPSNGDFYITGELQLAGDEDATIELTDLTGRRMYKDIAHVKNGKIDRQVKMNTQLANGMYLLSINCGAEHSVYRIVVER